MKHIPYGRHHITDEDIQAVTEVLKSDYLTQGPHVAEFEQAFAKYIGVKFAVAVSNGTAALHLCTLALGVKKGDKVITTGGIYGRINEVKDNSCTVDVGGDIKLKIDKNALLKDPSSDE